MITLNQLLKHFRTKAALADRLGITRQAVSRWEEDKPIPERHYLRLRYELEPKLFKQTNKPPHA